MLIANQPDSIWDLIILNQELIADQELSAVQELSVYCSVPRT